MSNNLPKWIVSLLADFDVVEIDADSLDDFALVHRKTPMLLHILGSFPSEKAASQKAPPRLLRSPR